MTALVLLQSETRFRQINMYQSPLSVAERTYYISYYLDLNGNYVVKEENNAYSFIVLPRAFNKATGINGDCGATYLTYFELAEIGGISR